MAKQAKPRHGDPVELPDRHLNGPDLALNMAAAKTVITNASSRDHTIMGLESLGYTVVPPGTPANTIEAVEPKFVPPNCPKCGAPAHVVSTRERMRYLGCTDEDCHHSFKVSRTAVT